MNETAMIIALAVLIIFGGPILVCVFASRRSDRLGGRFVERPLDESNASARYAQQAQAIADLAQPFPVVRYSGADHVLDADGLIATGNMIDNLLARVKSQDERLRIMGDAIKKERRRCADMAVDVVAEETGFTKGTWQILHERIMADPHKVQN